MGSAILLIFLAGLSDGLGTQSVVLFANRVGRRSFVLNLLTSGLLFLVSAVCWALSIWLIASRVFGLAIGPAQVIIIVGTSYAPLLLTFLALAPYYGPAVSALLHGASFALASAQVAQALTIRPPEALACTVGGWLLIQVARQLLGQPLGLADRRIWALTTSRPERLALEEIPALLARLGVPPGDEASR